MDELLGLNCLASQANTAQIKEKESTTSMASLAAAAIAAGADAERYSPVDDVNGYGCDEIVSNQANKANKGMKSSSSSEWANM